MSGKFDYNTVFHQMTWDEAQEANIALDLQIAEDNKAMNNK